MEIRCWRVAQAHGFWQNGLVHRLLATLFTVGLVNAAHGEPLSPPPLAVPEETPSVAAPGLHDGRWAVQLSGLHGFSGGVSGPGISAGVDVRRWRNVALALEGAFLSMDGRFALTSTHQVRVWLAALVRLWVHAGPVRFELSGGLSGQYVGETFSGMATGRSVGLGVAPQLSLGVLVAVSERIDLFARGFGQVSGGSVSPGFNSIWCAGLSLGVQLRFPAD